MKRRNRFLVALISAAFTFSILAVTVGTDHIGKRHHWHHGYHHDCHDQPDQEKPIDDPSESDSKSG